jgi:hypothetical protein
MTADIERWNQMTAEEREASLNSPAFVYWYEVKKQAERG